MRKFLFGIAALVACAAMFSACSSDSVGDDAGGTNKVAKFMSFGFYAADNAGLTTDYVADIASEMIIRLPEDTDKTKLVARFTTSDGDAVYVGVVAQKSGVTANDFSYPVDYIVKDVAAKITATYTVKVEKIVKVWSLVSTYNQVVDGTTLVNDDFAMAICPKTNVPYFFLARTNSSDVDAGVVLKLDEGTMTVTPEITFAKDGTTSVAAKNPGIAIDADGKVYAMYYYTNKVDNSNMFVKTGSGASWSVVGSTFGKTTCGSYYAMDIDPVTKRPIVGYYANSAFGSVVKRDLNMCYFDGSAWSSENRIPDLAGKYIYSQAMRVTNGTLYLGGTIQTAPGTYFVYKYNNGTWEKVVNALPAGVSQTNIVGFSFAVASDGTLYCCCGGDEDLVGEWKVTVYKAAPGATDWTRVSTAINAQVDRQSHYLMDLYNDQPVVFYRDLTSSMPMVVSLNAETRQWDTPVALGTTPVANKTISFGFDAKGVGYAAYLADSDNKALVVYKYDAAIDN